jgi:hypothetical protein
MIGRGETGGRAYGEYYIASSLIMEHRPGFYTPAKFFFKFF